MTEPQAPNKPIARWRWVLLWANVVAFIICIALTIVNAVLYLHH